MLGSFIAIGVSGGLSMLPLLTTAMSDVPERDAGLASGIVNVSMQVAAALGIAILGTLATDHTRGLVDGGASLPSALTDGYHLAFTVGAGSVAVAALVALLVVRAPRPREEVTVIDAEVVRA